VHLYELYDIDSHSHIGIRSIFLKKILELDRATQNQLSWCALLLDRKKKRTLRSTLATLRNRLGRHFPAFPKQRKRWAAAIICGGRCVSYG
jgi:hypothetical protein